MLFARYTSLKKLGTREPIFIPSIPLVKAYVFLAYPPQKLDFVPWVSYGILGLHWKSDLGFSSQI